MFVLQNLYAICDIAILITKDLGRKRMSAGDYPGVIPLPSLLYKAVEPIEASEPAEGAIGVEGTEGAEVKKPELENVKVNRHVSVYVMVVMFTKFYKENLSSPIFSLFI